MRPDRIRRLRAFALYEILIGVAIFALGVLALGRAVENCLNANALNGEEEAVRQMLANRMAEIQTAPGVRQTRTAPVRDVSAALDQALQSTRADLATGLKAARPETPITSVATLASLMLALSNAFCTRLIRVARSRTKVVR